jgi:hypothetical protein
MSPSPSCVPGSVLVVIWKVAYEPRPQLQASHGAMAISEARKGGEKNLHSSGNRCHPPACFDCKPERSPPKWFGGHCRIKSVRTVVQVMVHTPPVSA